jgi:glucokinase
MRSETQSPDGSGQGAILGIDIGGTKLAAGVVSRDGEVRSYLRQPTPHDKDAEALLAAVVELAERARGDACVSVDAVGIGCGGPLLYPDGIVSPLHIPAWRGFPLRERLAMALGLTAVLDNDAKAFALGEATFGAGRGSHCLLGMIVSTGVGGGIILDGRLLHGASGNAGHVGHVTVAAEGPLCPCGARGCVTAYASGTGLAARAYEAVAAGESSALAALPESQITGRAVVEAAAAGDALARRLLDDAAHALAIGIAGAANLLDLDRVVIGGGLAQAGELLLEPLRRALRSHTRLAFLRGLDVRPASLGPEAGVTGAAALAM